MVGTGIWHWSKIHAVMVQCSYTSLLLLSILKIQLQKTCSNINGWGSKVFYFLLYLNKVLLAWWRTAGKAGTKLSLKCGQNKRQKEVSSAASNIDKCLKRKIEWYFPLLIQNTDGFWWRQYIIGEHESFHVGTYTSRIHFIIRHPTEWDKHLCRKEQMQSQVTSTAGDYPQLGANKSETLCLSGTTGSTCAEASSKGITFKTYHHLLLEKTAHGHQVQTFLLK